MIAKLPAKSERDVVPCRRHAALLKGTGFTEDMEETLSANEAFEHVKRMRLAASREEREAAAYEARLATVELLNTVVEKLNDLHIDLHDIHRALDPDAPRLTR